MPAVERTIGESSCERCGSVLRTKTRRKDEHSDVLLVVSRCDGCHAELVHGFTTVSGMKLWNRRFRLTKYLDADPPPELRDRILEKLAKLDQLESIRRMGL